MIAAGSGVPNYLVTLRRAFAILGCFTMRRPYLTVAEICEQIGLPKSTVHRFLNVLMSENVIRDGPRPGQYMLGLRLFELGSVVRETFDIVQSSADMLQELSESLGEASHLIIRDGAEGICIHKVEPMGATVQYSRVGKRLPLYCTGAGKVLLSDLCEEELRRLLPAELPSRTPNSITRLDSLLPVLAEVRRLSYALDSQEFEIGLACVAAPVRDYSSRVIAATSVSGSSPRFSAERLPGFISAVQDAAARISQRMGYTPGHKGGLRRRGSD